MHRFPLALAIPAAAPLLGLSAPAPANDFDAVRAILERRCLECHGGTHRESGLSFADRATFAAGGARGPAVLTDDPGASRLLEVVAYGDPDLAMPPSGVLPADERAVLERWVRAGAPWPDGPAGRLADPLAHPLESTGGPAPEDPWWAYDALGAPTVPTVADPDWNAHPIDAFVRRDLDELGLIPAAPAAPDELLRRASFDLTGLPPSPAERLDFASAALERGLDTAWSELVDRLLASPHYGEHQARRWLDLVRYGETNGYERDGAKRNVWRYRDWVVRAYDRDLPYDEFAKLQLAGDEYAPDLTDPRAAVDAQLATGYYRLGLWDDEPSDPDQADADELADIVDTTSQVFMATTLGCARCHDHKADPLTQAEYFEFTAHFAGVVGFGGGGHGQHKGPGATRDLPDPDHEDLIVADERDRRLAELNAEADRRAAELHGDGGAPDAVLLPDARSATTAWRYLEGPAPDGWTTPAFDDSAWSEGPGGFGMERTPGSVVRTEWLSQQIHLRSTFRLDAVPTSLRLNVHYDDDVQVYINGQLVFERSGYVVEYGTHQLGVEALAALVIGRNVIAVGCVQDFGGQYIDVGLDTALDLGAEGAALPTLEYIVRERPEHPDREALATLIAEHRRVTALPTVEPYPAQVVFERGGEPPRQHVHLRGSVHAPGEAVDPDVPVAWSRSSPGGAAPHAVAEAASAAPSSGRRRAVADWLFDGGAHLAARVEANRIWQGLFGRGLCRTPGDFGRLGQRPTHPELLDHLARELIDRGWSRKALQRYVMASRSYRMATVGSDAALAADPRNDHFWRMNPRRLTAEEYRDATLAVSGELNRERFGPSVFPPLPAEVLATASRPDAAWGRATPAEAVRRSLYVHVKRSLREPLLAVLDQPDPDLPCPDRFPTNVPTQALLTLNGDFTGERAKAFAATLAAQADTPRERVALGIERALARPAAAAEVERGAGLVAELRESHGLAELEALELFALGLFNRNEFLWLD